jgi:hypothetical protein
LKKNEFMMHLTWKKEKTPEELHVLLRTLGEEHPVLENADGSELRFLRHSDPETLRVRKTEGVFEIEYHTLSAAARGVAHALADAETEERMSFQTFGVLWDCSRTGVVRTDYFKHALRRMALFGFNTAMLYTKDAYQVAGEPYFGYMRGAYSAEEIREIDDYAARLGIEMIASIQAMGHLEPILRWSCYGGIKDTDNVILPDCENSFVLLEKMIAFWSGNLRSRRIHLGMDETHDLGRGRFLDKNGYQSPYDIYNRHLRRLCTICEKFELKPMIWNDMYFRYANSSQNYYDTESEIPERVRNAIPADVTLCYWDYYHEDTEFYEKMLKRTEDLNGKKPLMASGIWTWTRLWYDPEITKNTVGPCLDACCKCGVRDVIFTMWGDDGGYCEFESSFAGMAWAADKAFHPEVSESRVTLLFRTVCGTDYKIQCALGEMDWNFCTADGKTAFHVSAPEVLWDDPLMGIIWHEYESYESTAWEKILRHYETLRELAGDRRNDHFAGDLDFAWNVCNVLCEKIALRQKILEKYAFRDTEELRSIAESGVPRVIQAVESLNAAFRTQWFRKYKSYGLEIMQIRLAGLCERYRELGRCLLEISADRGKTISELEISTIPGKRAGCLGVYRHIATGGWFI